VNLGQHANAERQLTKANPILLEMNAVPASTAAINKNCRVVVPLATAVHAGLRPQFSMKVMMLVQ
jgi:hypothetical protein